MRKVFTDIDNDDKFIVAESSNNGAMYFTKQLHELATGKISKEKLILVNHTPTPALFGWTLVTEWKDLPKTGMIAHYSRFSNNYTWIVVDIQYWSPKLYDHLIPNWSTTTFPEMLSNKNVYYHENLVVPARCGVQPELCVNTQLELWESILNQDMKLILS